MAQQGVLCSPTPRGENCNGNFAGNRASELFSRISETITKNRKELDSFRDAPNSSLGTLLDAQDRHNTSTPVDEMEELLERLEKLKDSKRNSPKNRGTANSTFSSRMGVCRLDNKIHQVANRI